MKSLPRQQIILIAAIFAAIFSALLIFYFLVFRAPMVPIYQNIRPSDASEIVAELDKRHIAFELANDGHDVLVPEDRASDARVAVAGANVALGGTIGFELFDDSDMGLTEFAQKINFQRAMQGELSRTIMMMKGVEFARVHLALPERSIFRAGREDPTAAVTIQMIQGELLTPQRIEGIQQLVASSVPGMAQAAVSILDDRGDLVSPRPNAGNGYSAPLDERSALARYYEAKASDVIRGIDPGQRFEVVINARRMPRSEIEPQIDDDRSSPNRDAITLGVSIRTSTPLGEDVKDHIRTAVVEALSLNLAGSDTLDFDVGVIGLTDRSQATQRRTVELRPVSASRSDMSDWPVPGGWRLWALVGVFLVILALTLRPRRKLDDAQTLSFAEQLRIIEPQAGDFHGG